MKLKCNILFVFFFCFFVETKAQNLVPNPDFETYTECPDTSFLGFHAILDSTWYQFGSADYFNVCDTSDYYGVPENFIGGYQYALSGNGYTGLIAYNPAGLSREYIEVELISSLIAGQVYYVRFYVSLPDDHQYAIENMGALFTDTLFDPYPLPIGTWLTGVPQVENAAGNMLDDKINWMEVLGSFIAVGGEKYISISNFQDDVNTVSQYLGSTSGSQSAYYYIDDVYVGTTPPPVSVHENVKDNHTIKVYPNPSNGNVTIECNLLVDESGVVNIYDITGKLIYVYTLNKNIQNIQIKAEELNSGMYLYEVNINGNKMKRDKFVVLK